VDTARTAKWAAAIAQFRFQAGSTRLSLRFEATADEARTGIERGAECHDGDVSSDLISGAAAGDEEAFRRLVDPHRRELHVHCYRILGSTEDAEDALQETLLAAWQGLGRFERRASIRTWLYRVATNRCLNMLRSASRRPRVEVPLEPDLPEPTRLSEVVWLEPYPDVLLEGLADDPPGPEARYEAREAISLAFVTAVQLLPPRQRAVLILRDVLGYRANEVAEMLDSTTESVRSALKRARATLERQIQRAADREPPPPPHSAAEKELVERLTRAFETSDVDGIVALLSEDVQFGMPPLEYHGRKRAAQFLTAVTLQGRRSNRAVATRANGQPAFGLYVRDPGGRVFHAMGLLVLTLAGNQVCAITRFDKSVLPRFGLPRKLPG
jgi:RNA polymerase sigma-70 factor (TIGR02960 family)